MNAKGPDGADERNMPFEPRAVEVADTRPGVDEDEGEPVETDESEGSQRFPRKSRGKEIPRESLAERMRRGRGRA